MPTDKNFKRLVRERMERTGELYTQARDALLRGEHDDDEAVVFQQAIDGRWSAEHPDDPGVIGYGPSKRLAALDRSNRAWSRRFAGSPFARRVLNALTLRREAPDRWTARASDRLEVVAEGTSRWLAEEALEMRLYGRHTSRFDRTVVLEKHDDGRWSAIAEGENSHSGLMGWGAGPNEAEAELMDKEDLESSLNDYPDDYAFYGDD
jgi:hypothetical protein